LKISWTVFDCMIKIIRDDERYRQKGENHRELEEKMMPFICLLPYKIRMIQLDDGKRNMVITKISEKISSKKLEEKEVEFLESVLQEIKRI